MTDTQRSGNPVKTAERVFEVLHGLKELDGAGVSELADHLGVAKSTVSRHLSTLVDAEYVVRDDDEFNLGLKFTEMGQYALSRYGVMEYVQPLVDDLADKIDERSLFVVEEHGMGVYLRRGTGSHAVNTGSGPGTRRHLHSIASGKAILANLPLERVGEILDNRGLPSFTENTITDREELFEDLERIRETGIAFNREERIDGLNAVAAPVLGPEDEVIGSIGVSGPSHRMKGEWFTEEVADDVLGTANELEINLAHADPTLHS